MIQHPIPNCCYQAKRALKTLIGTSEHVLLQDRIALIDSAIAVTKPHQLDEHTLLTNLKVLQDYVDVFPPPVLIAATEKLVKFRMARVFALKDREERVAAIGSLVLSLELWSTSGEEYTLLDLKNASYIPVIKSLANMMSKSDQSQGNSTQHK